MRRVSSARYLAGEEERQWSHAGDDDGRNEYFARMIWNYEWVNNEPNANPRDTRRRQAHLQDAGVIRDIDTERSVNPVDEPNIEHPGRIEPVTPDSQVEDNRNNDRQQTYYKCAPVGRALREMEREMCNRVGNSEGGCVQKG